MTRFLSIILLSALSFMMILTGCGGAHRYDGRLVAVDSLMKSDPDSALALVEAVSPDSLASEGDRAYRDLLLTQARYKCYIKATSDSDINRALNYYCHHSNDREKLTRAFIYKGAVMEELGHPDSAMYYYKTAEAVTDSTNYFYLGYANLRIAQLYQSFFANDTAVVARMKKATHYFMATNDTNYLITSIGTLGSYPKILGKDSAHIYLNQAINLSKRIHSHKGLQYQSKLAGMYFYDGEYNTAKDLAMDIFYNGRDKCNEQQFYYYAAISYIKLNYIDSAFWLIAQIPSPNNAVDSMNHFQTLAELAHATHHFNDYILYEEKAKAINTRLLEASRNTKLTKIEFEWDASQHEGKLKNEAKYQMLKVIAIVLLVIAILTAVFFSITKSRLRKYRQEIGNAKRDLEKLLCDLDQERLSFESERQDFISLIEEKDIKLAEVNKKSQQIELGLNQKIADIVRHRHLAINELYESIRIKSDTDKGRKRPLLLMSTLRELYEKKGILSTPLSQSFWDNLRYSVEGEYPGIMEFISKHYPDLTEDDMKLFMLCCAHFPNKIIKICMDYTSDVTTSKNKKKLLKEKFDLDVKFDDFIQLYLQGKLPSH